MRILISVLAIGWLLLATGCSTPYQTLSSMNYLEQGAVRAAAEMYDVGEISEKDWNRIVVADELFGDAWTDAVELNRDNPGAQKAAEARREVKRQAVEIADTVARWEEN